MRRTLNVVRVDVSWASLETDKKGEYSDWYVERLDRLVGGSVGRGLRIIASIWQTPCWASSAPESARQECRGEWWERDVGTYAPVDDEDYGDVVRWLAGRYGYALEAVEIWNEPNNAMFWRVPDGDPAARYAGLLRAGATGSRDGAPGVPVLAGSIGFADADFLQGMYAAGALGSYDGLALHPYNEWRSTSGRSAFASTRSSPGLRAMRETQLAAGDTTPVWATEFGWTTAQGQRREVS